MHELVAILAILPSLLVVVCMSYKDFMLWKRRHEIEEEEILHRFHNDPEKIRFYKGFKKYFAGELSIEGLDQWFEHHPRKIKPV